MRREPTSPGGPVREALLARWRGLAEERERAGESWLVDYDRLWALESGAPVVVAHAEVWRMLGGPAHPADRWFRLECDGAVTEVVRLLGTGTRAGHPAVWVAA
jgi:hypothetical protein